MPTYKKKLDFFATETGVQARIDLQAMEENDCFNTPECYTANTLRYPKNSMSFTEKHMDYLQKHPNLNSNQYIANLRLITRSR